MAGWVTRLPIASIDRSRPSLVCLPPPLSLSPWRKRCRHSSLANFWPGNHILFAPTYSLQAALIVRCQPLARQYFLHGPRANGRSLFPNFLGRGRSFCKPPARSYIKFSFFSHSSQFGHLTTQDFSFPGQRAGGFGQQKILIISQLGGGTGGDGWRGRWGLESDTRAESVTRNGWAVCEV